MTEWALCTDRMQNQNCGLQDSKRNSNRSRLDSCGEDLENLYVSLEEAKVVEEEPTTDARETTKNARTIALEKVEGTIGIVLDVRPGHWEYARLEDRVKSFKKVLKRNGHAVNLLALSGLFRTRHGETKCFHCAHFIEVPTGCDVWRFHAQTSPYCAHVRQCKGDAFVKAAIVSDKYQEIANETAQENIFDFENVLRSVSHLDVKSTGKETCDAVHDNRRLKENLMCKICFDSVASIVVLSCGHLATCAQCFPGLKVCPICRTEVKGAVRATFA